MITDVHQARLHASNITPHPTQILILVFTHKYFVFCFGESTTDYFSPFRLFHFACAWVPGGVVCLSPAGKFLHLNYLTCFLTDLCRPHFLFSTFTISAFVCRNFNTTFSKLFPARKLAVAARWHTPPHVVTLRQRFFIFPFDAFFNWPVRLALTALAGVNLSTSF